MICIVCIGRYLSVCVCIGMYLGVLTSIGKHWYVWLLVLVCIGTMVCILHINMY